MHKKDSNHQPISLHQRHTYTFSSYLPTGLLCFLLNRRLALTTFSTCPSAKLGAKIGRSMLLPAQSRSAASSVCRVTSKKDIRCASEPFALLTSTRRVRCRSFGVLSLVRNGLSGKIRRRKRGMVWYGLSLNVNFYVQLVRQEGKRE